MSPREHVNIPNVALVAPAIAREGITKQIANQILLLQQEKVKVYLIVLENIEENVLEEFGVHIDEHYVLNLKQPTSYLSPQAFLHSFLIVIHVFNFLKKNKVKVVVAHAPYAHFVMRLVKLLALITNYRFELQQYFHGLQYAQFPINSWRRFLVNSLNKGLALICDDGHISVCKAVKKDVEENLIKHNKHIVIYNPVRSSNARRINPERFDWFSDDEVKAKNQASFNVLLPGRIDYNKGQLFFIDVFKRFVDSKQLQKGDVKLLIVGEGNIKKELFVKIQDLRLEDKVSLTGDLSHHLVLYLMSSSDLVVVPSALEGMPMVVLEALNLKSLVLASNTGGVNEVIRDKETGYLFSAMNEEDCFQKLSFIYENRDKELINKATIKEDINLKFSFEQYIAQFLNLIKAGKSV